MILKLLTLPAEVFVRIGNQDGGSAKATRPVWAESQPAYGADD
jgi:hypothetical protein